MARTGRARRPPPPQVTAGDPEPVPLTQATPAALDSVHAHHRERLATGTGDLIALTGTHECPAQR